MARRWLVAAVVVTAMLAAGCSSHKTVTIRTSTGPASGTSTSAGATSSTATSSATSTESTPVAPLDATQCVDVTGANLDLLTANDKDAARKAADTLESYNPPASVKAAIEHFVTAGGAHFDDPDYTKNNNLIKEWVGQVCPT